MATYEYEYLDRPHPEENMPPTFKKKKACSGKPVGKPGELFPIDFNKIMEMNEKANQNDCPAEFLRQNTSTVIPPEPRHAIRLPCHVIPKTVKQPTSIQARAPISHTTPKHVKPGVTQRIAVTSAEAHAASMSNVDMPLTFRHQTMQQDVAQTYMHNASATPGMINAPKSTPMAKPDVPARYVRTSSAVAPIAIQRTEKSGVVKILTQSQKTFSTHHASVKRTSEGSQKSAGCQRISAQTPQVFAGRVCQSQTASPVLTDSETTQSEESAANETAVNRRTLQPLQSDNNNEQITMSMLFEKLLVIEKTSVQSMKYHIATKRVLDNLHANVNELRQEVILHPADNNDKLKLRLPIKNQAHLEEMETHFDRYEEDLRSHFNSYVGIKVFDMFRYYCDLLLPNIDYYNWSGIRAYNAIDNRKPKNASELRTFQLLVETGVEKMKVQRDFAVHEMARAITAFHAAVAARDKRRHV